MNPSLKIYYPDIDDFRTELILMQSSVMVCALNVQKNSMVKKTGI